MYMRLYVILFRAGKGQFPQKQTQIGKLLDMLSVRLHGVHPPNYNTTFLKKNPLTARYGVRLDRKKMPFRLPCAWWLPCTKVWFEARGTCRHECFGVHFKIPYLRIITG